MVIPTNMFICNTFFLKVGDYIQLYEYKTSKTSLLKVTEIISLYQFVALLRVNVNFNMRHFVDIKVSNTFYEITILTQEEVTAYLLNES